MTAAGGGPPSVDDDVPLDVPAGIYGPDGQPQFFSEPGMDRFVAALTNLASEVWVHEERLLALEGATGAVPAHDRDMILKGFIDRVFGPLRETRKPA